MCNTVCPKSQEEIYELYRKGRIAAAKAEKGE
jgi:hypothetical protein